MERGLEFVQLLGDRHRWVILRELARSDRRVHELTERVGEPQNLVSYHLRALRDAGLVTARRSSADGRDVYYRIDPDRWHQGWSEAAASLQPGLRLDDDPIDPALLRGRRVLFLCTGNSARSQMAEAFMRLRSAGRVDARSAGSHPKPLHPDAVRAMARYGIDISAAETKPVGRFARSHFDRVVTLCDKVREICPELPGHPELVHWSIPDPALDGGPDRPSLPAFLATAADMDRRVRALVSQLAADPMEVTTHG